MRVPSLLVFLAVGLLVAWLIGNAGMAGGTAFVVAFVPAILAAWLFDRAVEQKKKPS
jgi:hypothetical protein